MNRNTFAAAAPLLAALLGGPPALAQQAQAPGLVTNVQTVSDLAAVCDPRTGGVPRLESIAYCQGYFTAAGQYHTALHPAGGSRRPLYCLPSIGGCGSPPDAGEILSRAAGLGAESRGIGAIPWVSVRPTLHWIRPSSL